MNIKLNNDITQVEDAITVHNLIISLGENGKGMAVAVNNVFVPQSEWLSRKLSEGDDVVIIKAAYGG